MKSSKGKPKVLNCTICHKTATRTVDGEPSCEQHAQLIYEHQLEDYTKKHLADGEWKESVASNRTSKTAVVRPLATTVKV
jgi:hypothetical protein